VICWLSDGPGVAAFGAWNVSAWTTQLLMG